MEFVSSEEVRDLLKEHGLTQTSTSPTQVHLELPPHEDSVHFHIRSKDCTCPPRSGAKIVVRDKNKLAGLFEHILHQLSLSQVVLLPVGKWRGVFDAVAFSLAQLEEWQEFDASVTVELNTRDPLVCDSGDFHTLVELVGALYKDADQPEQGLTVLCTSLPVLMEVVPEGALRLSLGNQALADELADVLGI